MIPCFPCGTGRYLVNLGDVNRGNVKERCPRMHRKLPSSDKGPGNSLYMNVYGTVPIQQNFQVW